MLPLKAAKGFVRVNAKGGRYDAKGSSQALLARPRPGVATGLVRSQWLRRRPWGLWGGPAAEEPSPIARRGAMAVWPAQGLQSAALSHMVAAVPPPARPNF